MKKTFMSCNIVIRIISFLLLLIAYPPIRFLFDDFNIGRFLMCILIVLVLVFLCVCLNTMKIVVYDDKFVYYRIVKKVYFFDKIDSIEVEKNDCILVVYNGETHKIRGSLSSLDQLPSKEKNQKIVDYINLKRNKEELIYTKIDEVLEDKDVNLF